MPRQWWLCVALLLTLLASGISRAKASAQQPETEDDELQSLRPSRTLPIDRDLFDWTGGPGRLTISLNRSAAISATTTTSTSMGVGGRRFEYNLVISDPLSGHQTTKRRCLICPANSVVVTNLRCNCARMKRPVVRPCLESQRQRVSREISTRVAEGPGPGSLVNEGVHPVTLWVYDRQSPTPVHICRYTQTVVVKRCPPLTLAPSLLVNCTAGHRLNSRCRFQCQSGRILRGSQHSTCLKRPDGQVQWSHPPPACSALCPTAPSIANGKISCSIESPSSASSSGSTALTVCKYVCDEGLVIPRTQRKYQHWSCSQDGRWNQTQTPRCAKKDRPVPVGQSCADLNVTLDDSSTTLQLAVPQFRSAAAADASATVTVSCDLNSVSSGGQFQRRCMAVDNELDTRAACQQRVHVTEAKCRPLQAPVDGDLKCSTKNATTVCQVECRPGHSLLLKGHEAPVPSADRAAYCQWHDGLWVMGRHKTPLMELECELDPPTPKFEAQLKLRVAVVGPCRDEAAVESVKEALKSALIQRNSEVCREANCSQLDATCHDNDTTVDNVRLAAYLDVAWTVSADYTPIEDYYYEGVDVPEGESLIEKIQVETESIIRADQGFHRQIRQFGAHIQPHSFFVAKLDLVCHQPGYVVNEATNKCKKCPVNTFQDQGKCSPCADGTYQDVSGQTFCRQCDSSAHLTPAALLRFSTCQKGAARSSSTLSVRSQGGRPRGSRPAGYQAKKAAHLAALKAKKAALSTKALDGDQEPCRPGSNPCQAGARCIRYGQEAKCLCPIGLTGPYCAEAYCPPLMCFHGGTCTVRSGQWLCLCRQEYTGNRCQHHRPLKAVTKRQPVITTNAVSLHPTMGFCASNPCTNGGRCVDNSHAGYFTCICAPPFLGQLCQYSSCTALQRLSASCPSGSLCVGQSGRPSTLCLCPAHVKHPQCSGPMPPAP